MISIVQLVVELADVRILAFGTLGRPRSTVMINPNAHILLHPPGIESVGGGPAPKITHRVEDHGVYPIGATSITSQCGLIYFQPSRLLQLNWWQCHMST
jgi:hypothetical protein